MKCSAILFTAFIFMCLVETRQACAEVPGQHISYVRAVPTVIGNQMPKGAKSCFFGSFKLTLNSSNLLLHLYNSNAKTELAPGHSGPYLFTVDIFQVTKTSQKDRTSYRLLKRFPLTYRGWPWPPTKFGAQLLWLDPEQRRQPIIKFDCFTVGDYGPLGNNVIVVFPTGLTGEPIVQSLPFGGWKASDTSGQDNSFNRVDDNGLLAIYTQVYIPTSERPQPQPVILRWNGREFAPAQKNSDNGEE